MFNYIIKYKDKNLKEEDKAFLEEAKVFLKNNAIEYFYCFIN